MADEKKIIIEILDSSGGDAQKDKDNKNDSEEDGLSKTLNKIFHPIQTVESLTVGKNVLINQVYQRAKQQIIQAVDFYHNRYFSLKEDYLSEQTYNNARTAISKVTSFAGAVASGAIAGSTLGPAGTAAGAIIGTVGYGASEYFNQIKTVQNYNQQLNTIGMETNFARMRAGLVDNNRGTDS